ncbi:hypothetical protein EI969_00140 [Pseudomonas sp. PB101]|nr:hypothetical protein [Pseudomonas sp. PB101]
MGASLLAMAVGQATLMSPVPASSRASPLPQGSRVDCKTCGRPGFLWERACPRWRWVRQRMCWI